MANISDDQLEGLEVQQLRQILLRYPEDPVDIEGVILDYLGRSGDSLPAIFDMNSKIYKDLFTGPQNDSGKHLLKSLIDNIESTNLLIDQCRDIYPKIASILMEQKSVHEDRFARMSRFVEDPEEYLGYKADAVAWQISDIHFGKFNRVQGNPRELAYMLAKLAVDHKPLVPDVILITGDISSVASPREFDDFKIFCRELQTALWGSVHPERVMLVPGNHEVSWEAGGNADHLTAFKAAFSADDVCISPFGSAKAKFASGKVTVKRINRRPDSIPPFAIVTDKEKGVEFVLLVSSYFSGIIPEKVRTALETGTADQDFLDILRADEGAINQEYLYEISAMLDLNKATAIGLIHHNPIQYGIEICQNKFAPQLLETLSKKGIPLLFHGHVHQVESHGSRRPAVAGQSYPIPAPTLCSITTAGSGRGLNLHFWGPQSEKRLLHTFIWYFSETLGFNAADLTPRYRFTLKGSDLEVEHNM